jgi:hypothetical protein
MATVVNAIDKILQAAPTRTTNLAGARVLLTPTTNTFHVNAAGIADPVSIEFIGGLIDLEGAITFTATGGTLTGVTANSATLTYANMPGASATVTASVISNGQTYSEIRHITKLMDGVKGDTGGKGDTGVSGNQFATVRMYQWATTTPAKPTGSTTWTWATGANASYSASDGWAVAIPANPGTPLIKLHVAEMPITAAAGVVSSTVSYANSTVSAVSQNGGNGTSGLQSFAPTVYQWAATIPAGPTGAATLTWATGAFGAAPTNWSLTPGTAPSPGFTLWAARVQVSDSAAIASTGFNWTSAAVMAIGYAGGNGNPGAEGASYVTAYCATTVGTGTSAPAPTTGRNSLPAANSGGLTGVYSASVPALSAGQYQMQTDGIYNPAANQIIWSIPYQSSLKVAVLSAISANFGAMTGGSIDLGSGKITMDNAGNAVFHSITIKAANGDTILASGVPLNPAYAAPGTLNSALTASINSAATTAQWSNIAGQVNAPANNATADLQLVADGVVLTGNTAQKVAGAAAFDSSVRSQDSAPNGAFASAVAGQATAHIMFGLNGSDTTSNSGEVNLDYAIYLTSAGRYDVYQSNVSASAGGGFGDYVVGDSFSVLDDGSSIRYLKNGVNFYTSQIAASKLPNKQLYFDSSFHTVGGKLTNIRFIPLTSNADGVAALTAVNDAATGLNARLNKNAADILSGPIAIQGSGAFIAGTLTTDGSGNRTGGSGTAMTPKGFLAYNPAGVPTFTVDAATGDATFGGTLTASNVVTTGNIANNAATDVVLLESAPLTPANASSTALTSTSQFTTLLTYSFTPVVTGNVLVQYFVDIDYSTSATTVTYFDTPICRVDTGTYNAADNASPNARTGSNLVFGPATANFTVRKKLAVTAGVPVTTYLRAVCRSDATYTYTAKNISMLLEVIKK